MSHHGNHGYPLTQKIRAEKRKIAEDAHKEYNEQYPTIQAKLDALPIGGAKKQRARLEAKLLKQQQAAADKAEAEVQKKINKENKKKEKEAK